MIPLSDGVQVSLLSDLRAARPDLEDGVHPWNLVQRTLPLLVSGAEVTKVDIHADGHVGVRLRAPMKGSGRYYVVVVMGKVGTGLPDGRREVLLGASKYRDEADAMIFDRPFRAWLEPQPGVVTAWIAGVLLTSDPYSPR